MGEKKEQLVDRPQTIVELTVKNVQCIKAVSIKPDGDPVVVISSNGENGQGKSSTIKSILYGLDGPRSFPRKIVRNGQDEAEIVIKTQDLEIRRRIKEDGKQVLELRKNGVRVKTAPANALKELISDISFDPEKFMRLTPQEQGEHLRKLVRLDLSDLRDESERQYNERRDLKRDLEAAKAVLGRMVFTPGMPSEERSVSELQKELSAARKHNSVNIDRKRALANLRAERDALIRDRDKAKELIEKIKAELEETENKLADVAQKGKSLKAESEAFVPIDEEKIFSSLSEIEDTNRKVRENKARDDQEKMVSAISEKVKALDSSIAASRDEERRRIASLKMPIEGLGFDEDGFVTFDGIPYEQCSTALQRKIATKIGLSSDKKFRIVLITDGSNLSKTVMKELHDIAKEHITDECPYGAQIWVERVANDEDDAVVIEDGAVARLPEKYKDKDGQGNLGV